MSRHMAVSGSVVGTLALLLTTAQAHAQWLAVDPCNACAIPVAQPCYRTVPITEYRQIKQIVQRPICETKYVNQTVTAYRPVTEQRSVDVPTVSYQNVTECRTVYKNCGYWQTRMECRHLPSPCEYDPRADVFGWLNRTAYSIRATFTPRIAIRREYVPQVVAQQIPVTRTIAHHGTRRVTYNVTRMVAYTTTRKVAVNSVRYVAQEVTHTQPVTVWRTVPIGTTIAYASPSYATSSYTAPQTALQPTPDPVSDAKRTATSTNNKNDGGARGESNPKTNNDSSSLDSGRLDGLGTRRYERPTPVRTSGDRSDRLAGFVEAPVRRRVPSIVLTSRWISRSRPTAGPALGNPSMTIARNGNQ